MATAVAHGLQPRFSQLRDWLQWQRQLHPSSVDLGLERVVTVLERLGLQRPVFPIVTIGGTNGKGSTAAFIDSILRAEGYRVGVYTSPHLLRYNERIRIAGRDIDDASLCRAFALVDAARGHISLSFFEFGTLAAIQIFCAARVDVAVLEVGLGGRLDAVNAIAASVAIVTSIGIDHTDWLGPDRDSIGYEKAGIFRPGKAAICADPEPPRALLRHATCSGAALRLLGHDFGFEKNAADWRWWNEDQQREHLPLPRLAGIHQLYNASAALEAIHQLGAWLAVSDRAIRGGIENAYVPGRFQIVEGAIPWILDIAHNPQGAQMLAKCLSERPVSGRTFAVIGMLRDKDVVGVVDALLTEVDYWYPATLSGTRGLLGEQLAACLGGVGADTTAGFATVGEACRAAFDAAIAGDRIVVFGSLKTVSAAFRSSIIEEVNRG